MPQNEHRRFGPLGRTEISFFVCLTAFFALHLFEARFQWQVLAALPTFFLGVAAAYRLVRSILRGAIWRLRNRLIVAYLFIAVVPIILILAMAALAGYVIIGEMAVYLANRELDSRISSIYRQAGGLSRVPLRDPESALNRTGDMLRHSFSEFEILVAGSNELRYPEGSELTTVPDAWLRENHHSGLALRRKDGGEPRLYAWAHVQPQDPMPDRGPGRGSGRGPDRPPDRAPVTIVAPINSDLLASLVPGLGAVWFYDRVATSPTSLTGPAKSIHLPPKAHPFDIQIEGIYPMTVLDWGAPETHRSVVLVVTTRLSAVLNTVFQNRNWNEFVYFGLVAVSVLLLLVELASLLAGIQLSRTITGAVHEMYEGTRRVKDGDFSYRIPVRGRDQLAELSSSFNAMTEHLGRLIVVAKEKERLESELEIAREVQRQLFPKDVPRARNLELKGVCNPARMVSGDYYDFMSLPDRGLAFAIGDVAGKGISAALLMAAIQSTMRTQLTALNGGAPRCLSSAALVGTLNRQLYATTAPEKYATFYFALYDEATSTLTYTNAGHPAPLLLRHSVFETHESNGTVVGAFPHAKYREKTAVLEPGDLLVAYTDGIIEPENAYGEMFGEDRLKDLLMKYESAGSAEIIAHTMEAVIEWTGSSELQDDMTMIVARHL